MEFYFKIEKSSINQGLVKVATTSKEIKEVPDYAKKLKGTNAPILSSLSSRWSNFLTLVT